MILNDVFLSTLSEQLDNLKRLLRRFAQSGEWVTDYGARGDGVHDDTDAISAAINAAKASGGEVVFPVGTYKVTRTITAMQNAKGVILRGLGFSNQYAQGARLLWAGENDGRALLDMSGTDYCAIENLGFYANIHEPGKQSNVIAMKAVGNPTFHGSFFNDLRRVYFQNFAAGAELGTPGGIDQVDTWTFDKCWFFYDKLTGVGVRVHSANALVHQFYNCTFTALNVSTPAESSTGIDVFTGGVKLFGCITANNKYGVRFRQQPRGSSGIFAHHSENDHYPIYTDSTGGNHQKANPLTIVDLYAYGTQEALFYFANENMQYSVTGAYSQPAGGCDDIVVPDNPQEVWLMNVTHAGQVKARAAGTVCNVFGWYGIQTPGVRVWRTP